MTALGQIGQGRKTERLGARSNISRGEKVKFTYFPLLQRGVLGNSVDCMVLIKHRRA